MSEPRSSERLYSSSPSYWASCRLRVTFNDLTAELCFRAILYNIVLNIKQSNTDAEIENLTNHINSHKEKLKIVSADLKQFSEKLVAIEQDLSNLKEANQDIVELKQIQERLADYATSLRSEDSFVSSASSYIRSSVSPLIISCLLLKYYSS